MTAQQPEALRLADLLESRTTPWPVKAQAASELRRLHAENITLQSSTAPAAVAVPSKAVAYLDIGSGGYLDIGTDLDDEELLKLPSGRHMLAIVGTFGVDGYVPVSVAGLSLEQLLRDARHRIANLSRASVPFEDPLDGPILKALDAAIAAAPTTQAQAGAVPLTDDEALDAFCHTPGIHQFVQAFMAGVRFAEQHHGIEGGQHES